MNMGKFAKQEVVFIKCHRQRDSGLIRIVLIPGIPSNAATPDFIISL